MRIIGRYIYGILLMGIWTSALSQSDILQGEGSILDSMSLDEKIGQLFMIRAHSNLGKDHIQSIKDQIQKYNVGGLCFFQGTPKKQAQLTNQYQELSKIPLLVAMDAEWGLGMRHKKSALSFPKQLTLGAISDNTMIYDMGKDIAKQLRRIGVHVNFAPVVDVNNNSENPVIHNRSFGQDIYNVATKSYAYTKGMQDNNIMACAKHFPGHGDTNIDSHYDLPVIQHDRERLDSLELMPFRVMSQLGVMSMMSAHLSVPALDDRENRPTSLSKKVVTDILRNELNFDGLVFTDGLEMKGVANHFKPGFMELEAIKAGNDMLLLPIDIDEAFNTIKAAVKSGVIGEEIIDQKVERILKAKYKLGINTNSETLNLNGLDEDINSPESKALVTKLYEKALTLVKDDKSLLPVRKNNLENVAAISLGAESKTEFLSTLEKFGISKSYSFSHNIDNEAKDKLNNELRNIETVIIGVHDMSIFKSRDFGISKSSFDLIYELNSSKNIILCVFGSPYSLEFFTDIQSVLVAYEENDIVENVVAQALFGVSRINGKLPVTVNSTFPINSGIFRIGGFQMGYSTPEAVGVCSDSLLAIDTIIQEMFEKKAAPGCQVLAAKNGRIFYQKSFGHHTDNQNTKVTNTDVYDVASVTKILATTISLMRLYDEGKIKLHEPIKKYLNDIDTTNKASLIVEDILAHHSGLPGWIAFYENTLEEESKSVQRLPEYYRPEASDSFSLQVCQELYLRSDWKDSIYYKIYDCELRDSRDYRYSDLGFYIFHQIIEGLTDQTLNEYVDNTFYKPLGLNYTTFNPLSKIDKNMIPPSEKDDYFRDQVVQGYVHDMGAAMLGGVSGHAGLFSNSYELAVLMQMLLNGGSYAGQQFIHPQTIQKFTKRYYKSTRRGLGFDMKEMDPDNKLNMSELASEYTFGHLGFTGISVFADPKHDLIYIFLSNRTFPTMKNYVFGKENYRPRIQSVFYNALMESKS